jgi:hypothetical protein
MVVHNGSGYVRAVRIMGNWWSAYVVRPERRPSYVVYGQDQLTVLLDLKDRIHLNEEEEDTLRFYITAVRCRDGSPCSTAKK